MVIKRNKVNKYGNRKIEIDGHKFDSKLEARYYNELKLLKRAGKIKDFSLQPKFELQPNYKRGNKTIRKITYSADFRVEHIDGEIEIIDIKGHITKEFALKRKMLEYKYDMTLTVLCFSRQKGWYEV